MGEPVCSRAAHMSYDLGGYAAAYLPAVTDQWLEPAPYANPGILEMFRDRERHPRRDL